MRDARLEHAARRKGSGVVDIEVAAVTSIRSFGRTDDYGPAVFSEGDREALRDTLGTIQGRLILSINDVSEIRAQFARFTIEPVDLSYRGSGTVTAALESIISNSKEPDHGH